MWDMGPACTCSYPCPQQARTAPPQFPHWWKTQTSPRRHQEVSCSLPLPSPQLCSGSPALHSTQRDLGQSICHPAFDVPAELLSTLGEGLHGNRVTPNVCAPPHAGPLDWPSGKISCVCEAINDDGRNETVFSESVPPHSSDLGWRGLGGRPRKLLFHRRTRY